MSKSAASPVEHDTRAPFPAPELVQPGAEERAAANNLPLKFFPQGFCNPGFEPPKFLVDPAELAKIEPPASVRTFDQRLQQDLNEEQREAYKQFRKVVEDAGWAERGIDEWTTLRFLIARQFDLKKATKMLAAHVDWRTSYQPETRWCGKCVSDPASHITQFCGWDKQHHPVLYMSYLHGLEREDPRLAVEHNVMTFRQLANLMPEGVEQWVCLVDFHTYSHWRDGRSKVGGEVLELMQNQFPERLSAQILIDPPTVFWLLWKVLSGFVDEKTRNKVMFVYTEKEPNIRDEFPKLFPPHLSDYLIEAYTKNKTTHAERKKGKGKGDKSESETGDDAALGDE